MLRYYTASRLTPSQPFPVQGRPPLGIQTRTEPKTSKPSKHQSSAWISSTIWSADPKISQDIPSNSKHFKLAQAQSKSWQILAVTRCDRHAYGIWLCIMTYHDILCIKCRLHTFIDHTRWGKLECIGIWQNILPESGYCLPTVQQRSSKLSRSPWRSLEKQSDTSYSVALIPCRMISLSQRQ